MMKEFRTEDLAFSLQNKKKMIFISSEGIYNEKKKDLSKRAISAHVEENSFSFTGNYQL